MTPPARPADDPAPPPRAAWSVLLGLAAARLALHFAVGSGYGLFRDEFYYLACGARPDWGYVDQPPLVPLLARLAAAIWGDTTITAGELRTFSALAAAGMVVLAGLVARELGGGRFAQGLAALAVWCGPIFLATGELFETVVFDQLCWTLTLWLTLRAWKRAPGWRWLLVGLAAGVGLEVKFTMGMCGLGLAAALLFTAAGRRHLRSPWPWLGGALALGLLAPNLWWQHAHGWPTAEFVRNNNAVSREDWTVGQFLLAQVGSVNPAGLALALAGVWRAFVRPADGRSAVVPGWAFVVPLAVLLVTRGKPYYLGAAYPTLLAAGACAAEGWAARGRRWRGPALAGGVILMTLPAVPLVLPVVPRARLAGSWVARAQRDYGETFGWEELAAQVAGVVEKLPAAERARTAVFANNYGEAAALEHFGGPALAGVPVVSPHNNYWLWGPGSSDPQTLVVVGTRHPERWTPFFEQVERAATLDNSLGIDNEERGAGVYLCRGPRAPLRTRWAELKHFN